MSIDRNLYVGPYICIWMPEIKYKYNIETCSNESCREHKRYINSRYCPTCGNMVSDQEFEEERVQELHEFLTVEFDDGDMFRGVKAGHSLDYAIAAPNRPEQGGLYFEDENDVEIINFLKMPVDMIEVEFEKRDWRHLTAILDSKKILYEKRIGILQWYSYFLK